MSSHDSYINKLIFSKYLIRKKIGQGSFGTVYKGIDTINNQQIALKAEKREENDPGTLENEALRLVYLKGEGVPSVYCYGNNATHNLLVEELLGKSLEDLFNSYGKPFSLKTVCVLGIEMIKRIQYIHSKYFIHRDIKPDNFMTGRGENEKKIYIIDFGLAKKYYSLSRKKHIKFVTGKSLIGTARYCGRNSHRGYEQGRRDDIESIGYVLMYFLLGQLPWQGLKVKKNEERYERIARKKYSTSFEELTMGQPEEFLYYFKHADKLGFEDQPNYLYLIGLFQSVINKYCGDCLYDFDWKKDSLTYVSSNNININKKLDVSLIVNKNNDMSGLDYSNNLNDEDDNENNDDEYNKKKKILKKEVFMEHGNQPDKNNENNDNYKKYGEHNKLRKSKSMIIEGKGRHNAKNNKLNKKNKEKKNKNQDIGKNNPNDNYEYHYYKHNINNDRSKISDKNSQIDEKKNHLYEELNVPYSDENNNDINNINKKKFNYDYNDENNTQIIDEKKENNDNDTKERNKDENNNIDEILKDMSFEGIDEIKNGKINESQSYRKEKNEKVICRCIIF